MGPEWYAQQLAVTICHIDSIVGQKSRYGPNKKCIMLQPKNKFVTIDHIDVFSVN